MKKKYIYFFALFFLCLLVFPLFFSEKIEFDYGKFFTEYYLFLLNTVLVISLGYYFNNKMDKIKYSLNDTSKKKKLKDLLKNLLIDLNSKINIKLYPIYWKQIKIILNDVELDFLLVNQNLDKIDKFINSISEHNIDIKTTTSEYRLTTEYIKELINTIQNEIHNI